MTVATEFHTTSTEGSITLFMTSRIDATGRYGESAGGGSLGSRRRAAGEQRRGDQHDGGGRMAMTKVLHEEDDNWKPDLGQTSGNPVTVLYASAVNLPRAAI